MEIEPTSEPATGGELALVRAELLAEIRNLRTWAEGKIDALRQELFARIEKSEARMWKAMVAQVLAIAAIHKWL